jgi:5,10-methenyltetrahydromethanopterin hydrogenase
LSEAQFFDAFSQIKLFELGRVEQWLTQADQQKQLIKRYSDVLLEEKIITQACDCDHLVSANILELVKNEK